MDILIYNFQLQLYGASWLLSKATKYTDIKPTGNMLYMFSHSVSVLRKVMCCAQLKVFYKKNLKIF